MELHCAELEKKYEVLGQIGEGGMGAVFKVRHRLLDEVRVAKIIRPKVEADRQLQQRFLHEARLAVRLRHPNIAQLYDFAVGEDGTAYMVIEFVDGIDLARLIAHSSAPLPIGLSLEIGRQALEAVAYMHEQQIIHRDLSPDNLIVAQRDNGYPLVKLIDLGVAKSLRVETSLTAVGVFVGKLRYASPEQLAADVEHPIDLRSDIFSMGVVLYELLTGSHPFRGLSGQLYSPPSELTVTDPQGSVPAAVRAAILKAIARNPEHRFASADQLARELAACQAEHPLPVKAFAMILQACSSRTAVPAEAEVWVETVVPKPEPEAEPEPEAVPKAEPVASSGTVAYQSTPQTSPAPSAMLQAATAERTANLQVPDTTSESCRPVAVPGERTIAAAQVPPIDPVSTPDWRQGRRWLIVLIGLVVVITLVLSLRSAQVPAPVPQATVVVYAAPWGELIKIVDTENHELQLPERPYTPLVLKLAPGAYNLTLIHPDARSASTLEVRVVSGETVSVRAILLAPDVEGFLRQHGGLP